jgi:hypothetical protein
MDPGLRRDHGVFRPRRRKLMPRMRYTKAALLVFGLGLVVGFVVVVGEFSEWERLAAAIMALGLVLIPIGLFADGHGMAAIRCVVARFRRKKRPRPRAKSRRPPARRKPPGRKPSRAPRRKRS